MMDISSHRRVPWTRVAAFILLLLAVAEFSGRGLVRGLRSGGDFNDFLSPYVQSRAWVSGADPYSPKSLVDFWPEGAPKFEFLHHEAENGTLLVNRGMPTAYTPSCLLLVAPFSFLPWLVATKLWLLFSSLLLVGWIFLLIPQDWDWYETRSLTFLALALALAPLHTGLATANPAIPAAALGGIGVCLLRRSHAAITAALLGVSIILKPQIGLCFLIFAVVKGCWRTAIWAMGGVTAATLLAILRMQVSHTNWIASYVVDNRALFSGGMLTDFTASNPTRWGLINAQLLAYTFLGNRSAANEAAWLIFITLGFLWLFWAVRSVSGADDPLLDLAAMLVLSLLPIYHRFYDAVVLIVPLAWILKEWHRQHAFTRLGVSFALAPFLVPGGTLLEVLQSKGRIPPSIANSWWWQMMVLPHEVWALMGLSFLLLYAMAPNKRQAAAKEGTYSTADTRPQAQVLEQAS
jgi:hypothetical protein